MNANSLAPIALFVYARLDHTKSTLEALSENNLSKDTVLWIFSDGAKNEKAIEGVNEVKKYIKTIEQKNWFKEVHIIDSPKNKGLANSIITGVSKVIQKYKKVIVVEDDLVTAPDYLEFMNQALNFYESNPNIGSITGYSPLENYPSNYEHDVYLATRTCSYGWATWIDRWEKVDWEASDYKKLRKDSKLRKRFNLYGIDRYRRIERQMKGTIDSWSIRFGLFQFMNDLYTIYPVVSRLKNIGWDGSGTHNTKKTNTQTIIYNQTISDKKTPFTLENLEVDERIVKSFKDKYSGTLKNKIAYNLRNYWLIIKSLFK